MTVGIAVLWVEYLQGSWAQAGPKPAKPSIRQETKTREEMQKGLHQLPGSGSHGESSERLAPASWSKLVRVKRW